ncbi:uncharacterized protein LOC134231686 [Saccostrea cucullata]|uniref:uncharacterized protein LOC134231686 n=1 Tax=Saccostrea cuccullata TaxID=36930 RepID=UPI002ED1D1DC
MRFPGGELQTSMINELIVKAINSQAFIGAFAPLIASAITPHSQVIVQSCIQPILSSIQEQQKDIEDQNEQIQSLKEINSDLKQRVDDLECGLDNLEQYGRRTSLRFHNVPIPAPGSEDEEEVAPDTDASVIKICEGMGVTISPEDINRSHPIGRPNKNNKIQIICKFQSWKIKKPKCTVPKKKTLKNNADRIFFRKDITKYRQTIVSKIIQAKNTKVVHSFWTYDGRIYIKFELQGTRFEMTSLDQLDYLLNR